MKRNVLLAIVWLVGSFVFLAPAHAEDQITYISQPDEVYVFLNNIAFVRDRINLPANVSVRIALPAQFYQNTLIVREGGEWVPTYRLRQEDGQVTLAWETASSTETREATLEYLLAGLSWRPKYDMWLGDETAETVGFNFFAEIQNSVLDLDGVALHLIAGRVDTSQQLDALSTVTANQYLAGYDDAGVQTGDVGAVTIQYIYDPGELTSNMGDTVYLSLSQSTLPARRIILWNAETDQQASVIYKIRNESGVPFAEGTVRSYQNDIFIGSDFIEITPVSSEGSVTVGKLQNLRVNRSESVTAIEGLSFYDAQHQVELTLTNFGERPVEVEVVDRQRPEGEEFVFAMEPQRETGNILRWVVTLEPGETVTITYEFKTR